MTAIKHIFVHNWSINESDNFEFLEIVVKNMKNSFFFENEKN